MHQSTPAILMSIVLAILTVPFQALHSQPWLEDGRSCFCLRHEQGQVIADCIGIKGSKDFYVTAICHGGSERRDRLSKLTVRPPWMPVQDGAPGCTPCRTQERETKTLPRQAPK
jgi:hypothetical protein